MPINGGWVVGDGDAAWRPPHHVLVCQGCSIVYAEPRPPKGDTGTKIVGTVGKTGANMVQVGNSNMVVYKLAH